MGRGRWEGPQPAWEAAGPCHSQRGLPGKGRPYTVSTCLPCSSSFARPVCWVLTATLRSRNCNQAHFQIERQRSKEIRRSPKITQSFMLVAECTPRSEGCKNNSYLLIPACSKPAPGLILSSSPPPLEGGTLTILVLQMRNRGHRDGK